jgi:hypothetical protein
MDAATVPLHLLPAGGPIVTGRRCPEPAEIPHLAAHFTSPIRIGINFFALCRNLGCAAKRTGRRRRQDGRLGVCPSHSVPVSGGALGAAARAWMALLNFWIRSRCRSLRLRSFWNRARSPFRLDIYWLHPDERRDVTINRVCRRRRGLRPRLAAAHRARPSA